MQLKSCLKISVFVLIISLPVLSFAAAPEAISNLTALIGTLDGEIRLEWTVPVDSDGDLSGYELRFSTTGNIFDETDYSTATYYNQLSTVAVGGTPSVTLTGLVPGTTYYWAVKAFDLVSTTSTWSRQAGVNEANWAPAQDLAPASPSGLALTPGNALVTVLWTQNSEPDINLYEIQSSSYSDSNGFTVIGTTTQPNVTFPHTGLINGNTYYYKISALDNTSHYSLFSATQSAVPTVSLSAPAWSAVASAIGPVSLRWNWNNVSNEQGYRVFSSTDGNMSGDLAIDTTYWVETNLSTNTAYSRYVQAFNGLITSNSATTTYYTLASTPTALASPSQTVSIIDLSWNANGNPGGTRYNVERSTNGVTNWALIASLITSTTHQDTLSLSEKTTYYYRSEALNGDGVSSGYSTLLSTSTASVPPGGVVDLNASPGSDDGIVSFSWTAPGDDGPNGTATKYILHYATFDITTSNFDAPGVSTFTQSWGPQSGGLGESRIVTGLYPGTTYWFALKAEDEVGNRGNWSTSGVNTFRSDWAADFPPPAPTGLSAVASGNDITISWSPLSGEPDIDHYKIFGDSTTPYDFSDEYIVSNNASPPNFMHTSLANETTYYYRLKAYDTGADGDLFSVVLESNYSSPVSAITMDAVAPAAVTNLSASPGTSEGKINLTWTSPGDDGNSKTLNGSFRIDYSTDPAHVFTYSSYKVNIPTSTAPGSSNSLEISGDLTPGDTYYIRIFSADEVPNFSSVSNGATTYAQTDVTPPAMITDLTVQARWRRAELAWTSPGDDGTNGSLNGTFQIKYSTSGVIDDLPKFNVAPYEVLITTSIAPGIAVSTAISGLNNGTTYYFAIRARDESNNYSALYTLPPQALPVNTAPAAFNLVSPADLSAVATLTPTFDWSNSSDSDAAYGDSFSYDIEYSTSSLFEVAITTKVNTASVSAFIAPQSLAEDSLIWWRVNAVDAEGAKTLASPGPWRVGINTTNSAPASFNLLSPANGSSVNSLMPVLDWADSIDSDPLDTITYILEYSTNSSFASYNQVTAIAGSSYTFTVPLVENVVYWWRVRSTDGDSITLGLQTNSFMVDAAGEPPGQFALTGPDDNSRVTTLIPIFVWQSSVDPDPGSTVTYTLVYSNSSNFTSSVTVTGLTNTSFTQVTPLSDNTYYWWYVRALDDTGFTRNSNDTRKFYTDIVKEVPQMFELLTPTGSIKVDTLQPVFDWDDAVDPDPGDTVRYFIEISANPDFTGAIPIPTGTDSFFVPNSDLTDDTIYYWRIKTSGYVGVPPKMVDPNQIIAGPGIFMVSLVNSPPGNFILLSPDNGTILNTLSPAFDWSDAVDSDFNDQVTYTLRISTSTQFVPCRSYDGITSSSYSLVTLDFENRAYYWKVEAKDKEGAATTSSNVFSFSVPVINRLKEPTGLSGSLSSDRTQFTITWTGVTSNTDGTAVVDLGGYNIYRSLFSSTLGQTLPVGSAVPLATNWTDVAADGGGSFYMVRAVDKSGIESQDSVAVGSGIRATFVAMSEDRKAEVHMSREAATILQANTNARNEDLRLHIDRRSSEEIGRVLRSYNFVIKLAGSDTVWDGFVFDKVVEIGFPVGQLSGVTGNSSHAQNSAPQDPSSLAIFWNNGVEFVNLGGKYDPENGLMYVTTRYPGVYQLRNVLRASEFELVRVWPNKIFTPNGDGINDEINFVVDNPKGSIFGGKIYNLHGEKVADMKVSGDETTLIWDGKESDGSYARKGVYLYQIKVEGKEINGTIVVAR